MANIVAPTAAQRTARAVRFMRATIRPRARRGPLPRKLWPSTEERDYAAALERMTVDAVAPALVDVVRAMPALVTRARTARVDGIRADAGEARAVVDAAYRRMIAAIPVRAIAEAANRYAHRVSAHNLKQLGKQLAAAFGVDVSIPDSRAPKTIEAFIDQNVSLVLDNIERLVGNVEKDITRILASTRVDSRRVAPVRHDATAGTLGNVNLIVIRPTDFESNANALGDEIERNVNLGGTNAELAEVIRDRFGFARDHAAFIARDQVGKLNGQLDAQRQQNLGVSRFIWRTVGDERVREEHAARDGQTYDYDDPPDGELPGEPINCFVAETRVSSYAPVRRLYRRRFRGVGSIIETDDGRSLQSTPNHPLLTLRGWVPAHLVEVGDYLIEVGNERIDSVVADSERGDATIGEIFNALLPLGGVHTREAMSGRFHGDVSDEDVDVVDVHGGLGVEFDVELSKSFCYDLLARTDESRTSKSGFRLLFNRTLASSDGIVRRGCDLLAVLLGRGLHADEHRSAAISRLDAIAQELGANGCARDAEVFRKALHAPSVSKHPGRTAARVIVCVVRRAIDPAACLHTESAERLAEIVATESDDRRHLGDGVVVEKFLCVVENRRCELVTHVFNLETESGWYSAEGIINRNCRCSAEPVFDDIFEDIDATAPEEPADRVIIPPDIDTRPPAPVSEPPPIIADREVMRVVPNPNARATRLSFSHVGASFAKTPLDDDRARKGAWAELDQKAIRTHHVEMLARHRFAERDRSEHLPLANRIGVRTTLGGNALATHNSRTGEILFAEREALNLHAFHQDMSSGRDFAAEHRQLSSIQNPSTAERAKLNELEARVNAYSTMHHENIHGHGPAFEYAKEGIAIEEIATEVSARRVTREALGVTLDDDVTGLRDRGGAYGKIIDGARDSIRDVLVDEGIIRSGPVGKDLQSILQHNLNPPEDRRAYTLLEDAAMRYKQTTSSKPLTPTESVRRLVENIDIDGAAGRALGADERKRIRERIEKRFVDVARSM